MALESGEIIRAINKGDMPLTLTYGSRDYVLHPDREAAIPFDCMVSYFGDPRAMSTIRSVRDTFGIVTWIPDRDTEVRRLRVKWGIYAGDARLIQLNIPVEFYDFDGQRIETVVDDPLGERINIQPQTVSEVSLLHSQVVALQARLDQVEAANRPGASPVDAEIEDSAFDGNETLPTSSLEDQAVAHFAHPAGTSPVSPTRDASDIPVDSSQSDYQGGVAAQSHSVTDETGNTVKLQYTAEDLARMRDEA